MSKSTNSSINKSRNVAHQTKAKWVQNSVAEGENTAKSVTQDSDRSIWYWKIQCGTFGTENSVPEHSIQVTGTFGTGKFGMELSVQVMEDYVTALYKLS